MGQTLIRYGHISIIKEVFEGKLGSSTGQKGRELSLPRMRSDAQVVLLNNLTVRTGNVIGKVDTMNFKRVSNHLRGTVFEWTACGEEVEDEFASNE